MRGFQNGSFFKFNREVPEILNFSAPKNAFLKIFEGFFALFWE